MKINWTLMNAHFLEMNIKGCWVILWHVYELLICKSYCYMVLEMVVVQDAMFSGEALYSSKQQFSAVGSMRQTEALASVIFSWFF